MILTVVLPVWVGVKTTVKEKVQEENSFGFGNFWEIDGRAKQQAFICKGRDRELKGLE